MKLKKLVIGDNNVNLSFNCYLNLYNNYSIVLERLWKYISLQIVWQLDRVNMLIFKTNVEKLAN